MIKKYRRKSASVEAKQWVGHKDRELEEVINWGCSVEPGKFWGDEQSKDKWTLLVALPSGKIPCSVGSWIIKENKTFIVVSPEEFSKTFEEVK